MHLGGIRRLGEHGMGIAEKRRGDVECSSGCSRVLVGVGKSRSTEVKGRE